MKLGKNVEDPGSETPSTDEDKPGRGFRLVANILFGTLPVKISPEIDLPCYVNHSDRPKSYYTNGKHREKVPCSVCGKHLSRGGMPAHMKLHDQKTDFQCEKCQKFFCSGFRLKKHMETHMEAVISCSLCDYKAKTEPQLRQHMNKHMGITFDCHLCPVKLSSKSGLQEGVLRRTLAVSTKNSRFRKLSYRIT